MRVIKQDIFNDLKVSVNVDDSHISIQQGSIKWICIDVDAQGAKQLIEVLKEFVNENQN